VELFFYLPLMLRSNIRERKVCWWKLNRAFIIYWLLCLPDGRSAHRLSTPKLPESWCLACHCGKIPAVTHLLHSAQCKRTLFSSSYHHFVSQANKQGDQCAADASKLKGPFGLSLLKFNSHHINIFSNAWSIKCRLITCISTQIRSNLRDESIKPN
jgi:hypothetical protein